ncbi:flagellar basal body P-ring protein FlgI [bacterium]|nr:flagellar basal body P-ring protein FlgI [bacterium]
MNRSLRVLLCAALLLTCPIPGSGSVAVRVKDLARVDGIRNNQLMGYGLVTGLEGTGDGTRSLFTLQSIANMLQRFGVTISPTSIRVDNVAAVLVTVTLPPYVRPGDRLDVQVSSIGDAANLQGGVLLQTPLMGADGKVYAVAQGGLSIGGFNPKTGGARVQRNHPVLANVPNGAIVEKEVASEIAIKDNGIRLLLNAPDFVTAARLTATINRSFSAPLAKADDPQAVSVKLPDKFLEDPVTFLAILQDLEVEPDQPARIVINERTGTVIMGENVRIAKVAVAHGNISVNIQDPANPDAAPKAEKIVNVPDGASVSDVVSALNALGATPRDIISILQAMRTAGALFAEIVLI